MTDEPNYRYDHVNEATDEKAIDVSPSPKPARHLHFGKLIQIVSVVLIFGVILPSLAYMIFVSREIDVLSEHFPTYSGRTCSHPDEYRIACGHPNVTASSCTHQHCCYSVMSGCYHSMPSRYQYFTTYQNESLRNLESSVERTPFRNVLTSSLQLILQEKSSNRLRIQIGKSVDEVNVKNESSIFSYRINEAEFTLDIYKNNSGKLLLTTKYGAFIASKGYFEWSLLIKNATKLYGLGQFPIKSHPFKRLLLHNGNSENTFIPFVLAKDKTNHFSGILVQTNDIMEIEVLASNIITIRTMSNRKIEIDFIHTSNYVSFLNELKQIYGKKFFIPEYWMQGVHICDNLNLDDIHQEEAISTSVNRFLVANVNSLPFDSHCITENLFLWTSFQRSEPNAELIEIVSILRNHGKKIVFSVYPLLPIDSNAFTYSDALSNHLLLRHDTDAPYIGQAKGNKTIAFIDWTNPMSTIRMKKYFSTIVQKLGDGVILHNICLKDFSANVTKKIDSNSFPFIPQSFPEATENLMPPQMLLSNRNETVLTSYNSLPLHFLKAIQSMTAELKLPIIMASVTEPFSNVMTFNQDFASTWNGLQQFFAHILSESILSNQFVGPNVCGNSNGNNVDEELCLRWYQLAAVTPVFRLTLNKIPSTFSAVIQRHMLAAIELRFSLLAYFNTILLQNMPVIRPLFYEFNNVTVHGEFLLGDALLVFPIVNPNQTYSEIPIYFPDIYYDFHFGFMIPKVGYTQMMVYESPLFVFIRSGFIVPTHQCQDVKSAEECKMKPLTLVIALNCSKTVDKQCSATGQFGTSSSGIWNFHADTEKLTIKSNETNQETVPMKCENSDIQISIWTLKIYGMPNTTATLVLELPVNIGLCRQQNDIVYYYNL